MFKRGDIVELNLKRTDGLREVGILKDADYLISAHDGKVQSTAGYEMTKPPIYEKVGRRFVASGEFRFVKVGDYWLDGKITDEESWSVVGPMKVQLDDDANDIAVPIILPIPELEPEHEFEIGDWVRITEDNPNHSRLPVGVYRVDCVMSKGSIGIDGLVVSPEFLTKLPGRPLTTDDLMHLMGGNIVCAHWNMCCGGEKVGSVFWDEERVSVGGWRVVFRHSDADEFLAEFKDGSIVFADGVEGNIFVVSE